MRVLRYGLPVMLLCHAGAALAQTPEQAGPRYNVIATVGGPYAFDDNSILPDFETEDIEGTIAFEVSVKPWSFLYRHAETGDGDGERVQVQFKEKNDCPLLRGIGCTARVRWNDASNETVTYRLALHDELHPWRGITPTWTFAIDAITVDREAVVYSPELRFSADWWKPLIVTANVGASYSGDNDNADTTWGIEVSREFAQRWSIAAGYASRVTFDDVTGEFGEVERDATLTLRYSFGPGG